MGENDRGIVPGNFKKIPRENFQLEIFFNNTAL